VENVPARRAVKLGDILPSFSNFDTILRSLKSYKIWPSIVREALLDRAISGVECTQEESDLAWEIWCKRNEVDPTKPLFEGLSVDEMRMASTREMRLDKFKEQVFAKHLPEYFRSRKAELDRIHIEVVHFHHEAVAEEALFRCREGEQSLESAAHELAHRDGGEPAIKKVGPIALGRLPTGLISLVSGSRPGTLLGPKKHGHFYIIVRVLELKEAALDTRTRNRLLDELVNQWVEQQMAAMTGRAARPVATQLQDSYG
jgi:hypothetical protein